MNSWKKSVRILQSVSYWKVFVFCFFQYLQSYTMAKKENWAVSMDKCLCSNARAPVAQLVRASDQNSEDPGSNSGWNSMSFRHLQYHIALHNQRCINHNNNVCQGLLIRCHVMPCNQGHINSKLWCNLVSHICSMKFYIDYCQNTPSLHVLCRVPYAESHKNLIRTSQYLITVSNKRFGTVTQASYKKN